jgi:hypothetical protein
MELNHSDISGQACEYPASRDSESHATMIEEE